MPITNWENTSDKLRNSIIDGEHAVNVFNSFMDVNAGDEATTDLLIGVFAELFDCSADALTEIM